MMHFKLLQAHCSVFLKQQMQHFLSHCASSAAAAGHVYHPQFQPEQYHLLNGTVEDHRKNWELSTSKNWELSYHGAGPLLHEARKIIAETAVGEGRLMSAKMMMDTLRARGNIS
jgi:hypothetical protein